MLAVVFKGEGELVLEQRPVPEIEDSHDVKLAVKGVGVCGTDLHILEVPPRHPATKDVILGHEFCGEVVEVGSAARNCKQGDHVAVDQKCGLWPLRRVPSGPPQHLPVGAECPCSRVLQHTGYTPRRRFGQIHRGSRLQDIPSGSSRSLVSPCHHRDRGMCVQRVEEGLA